MNSRTASAASTSRERLEKISHHFLTGPGSRTRPEAGHPHVMPIVSVSGDVPFPHHSLAQALCARGRLARILEVYWGPQESASPTSTPDTSHHTEAAPPLPEGGGGPALDSAAIRERAAALDPAPALCLVPLQARHVTVAVEFGGVLMGVPASRDGLLAAYRFSKAALALREGVTLGVTILHARDRPSAALHFEKLADGVRRFLGVEVVSFGFIPAPPNPYAPVDLLAPEPPDTAQTRAVEGIATLILADLCDADLEAATAGSARTVSRGATVRAAGNS